ncbi:MAG: peptidoglycan editing factor PgeF [bacterium]
MKKIIDDIVYYQFLLFEAYSAELKHLVTTRLGGYSKKPYNSLNIGFHVGDSHANVLKNRKLVCNKLGYALDSMVSMQQSHGANIKVLDSAYKGRGARNWEDGIANVDGVITNNRELVLLSMSADCGMSMFYDPGKKVLALAHSGWRGIAKGVVRNIIETMETIFSCERSEILVGIGPTICERCYEIGSEIRAIFEQTFPFDKQRIFSKSSNGSQSLNIVKSLELQLLAEGIKPNHIETSNLCNSCESEEFFSYRRDNKKTGRMGIFAVIE